jgi:hypothetical protein
MHGQPHVRFKKDVFRTCGAHGVKRNSYIILGGRSEGRRSFGRSKRGWNTLCMCYSFNEIDVTMFSVGTWRSGQVNGSYLLIR